MNKDADDKAFGKSLQAILQNIHDRQTSDLPESVRLLYGLEKTLRGQDGLFGEWLRTAYELYEAEMIPPADMARNICNAFLHANRQYGNRFARELYDSQAAVLPEEILNAAEYLRIGGSIEHIQALCNSGFFMPTEYEKLSVEQKKQAAVHMNGGGSVDNVFQAIADMDAKQEFDMGIQFS